MPTLPYYLQALSQLIAIGVFGIAAGSAWIAAIAITSLLIFDVDPFAAGVFRHGQRRRQRQRSPVCCAGVAVVNC